MAGSWLQQELKAQGTSAEGDRSRGPESAGNELGLASSLVLPLLLPLVPGLG